MRRQLATLDRALAGAIQLAGLALAGTPAAAELGGNRRGVDADRFHLAATMASSGAATHTVHTLTLPDGDTIREFAAADGTVFAVTWDGPARPDLRQLLGTAFATLQTDVAAGRRRPRAAMRVARDDLVVRGEGHPGAFHGFAVLPHLVPAGFRADALD